MVNRYERIEQLTIAGVLLICLLSLILATIIFSNDNANMFSKFMPIFYLIFGFVQCGIFNGSIKLIKMSYLDAHNKNLKSLLMLIGYIITIVLCIIAALTYVYIIAIILKI